MFLALLSTPDLELRFENDPVEGGDPVVTAAVPGTDGRYRVVAVFGPGIQVLARRVIPDEVAEAKLAEAPGLRRIIPHRPWTERAQCRVVDGAKVEDKVWFGNEEGARPALKRSDMSAARRICSRCPVSTECLTDALTDERPMELYGIWAGSSRNQRRELLRRIDKNPDLTMEEVITEWVTKLQSGSIRA